MPRHVEVQPQSLISGLALASYVLIAGLGLSMIPAGVAAQTALDPTEAPAPLGTPPVADQDAAGAPAELEGLALGGFQAPVNVTGRWTGTVLEQGSRFSTTWTLTQNAGQVRGNVSEARIAGSGYGRYSLNAQASAEGVTYQAAAWASVRPAGWCLPAGSLVYSRDDKMEYLAGRLRPNSVAGGCTTTKSRATRNLTSRGDTGKVKANCQGNSSAGACPRGAVGSIKLQRELR